MGRAEIGLRGVSILAILDFQGTRQIASVSTVALACTRVCRCLCVCLCVLYVTGPAVEVARALGTLGVPVDRLGDYFTGEGSRKEPHDSILRVVHDMAQASALGGVIMGDKERPDDYNIFNVGHVLDVGEQRQRPFFQLFPIPLTMALITHTHDRDRAKS